MHCPDAGEVAGDVGKGSSAICCDVVRRINRRCADDVSRLPILRIEHDSLHIAAGKRNAVDGAARHRAIANVATRSKEKNIGRVRAIEPPAVGNLRQAIHSNRIDLSDGVALVNRFIQMRVAANDDATARHRICRNWRSERHAGRVALHDWSSRTDQGRWRESEVRLIVVGVIGRVIKGGKILGAAISYGAAGDYDGLDRGSASIAIDNFLPSRTDGLSARPGVS